jgi:hypothetical protein
MRAVRIVLPALVALATASSALADPPATLPESQAAPATIPSPATANSPATAKGVTSVASYGAIPDTKMICKTEVPTGSRLGGHRVCMTKRDWDAQAAAARDSVNAAQAKKH